jgi:hypothetical protein
VRRWLRRRRADQRAKLAADVMRLAGFADATVAMARRIGAPLPGGVRNCLRTWHDWAWRLADWADDA